MAMSPSCSRCFCQLVCRPAYPSSAQTARRADSPCAVGQITSTFPAIPPALRGAHRDRHGTLRRGAVAAGRRSISFGGADERRAADGQAVWSRHPDAGVLVGDDVDDGGKQARSPGRARSSRSNHRAGKAGLFPAEPVVPAPCTLFRTGAAGASRHSAFPAPSQLMRTLTCSRARANPAARLRAHGRELRRRAAGCLTRLIGDQRAGLKRDLGGSNARLRQEASPGTLRPLDYSAAAPRVAQRAKRGAQGRDRTLRYTYDIQRVFCYVFLGVPASVPCRFRGRCSKGYPAAVRDRTAQRGLSAKGSWAFRACFASAPGVSGEAPRRGSLSRGTYCMILARKPRQAHDMATMTTLSPKPSKASTRQR